MKKLLMIVMLLSISSIGFSANISAGKTKYNTICKACHGDNGKLGVSGAKDISGKSAKYIYKKLVAYKASKIKSPTASIMLGMVAPLSKADMHNVSAFIAKNIK